MDFIAGSFMYLISFSSYLQKIGICFSFSIDNQKNSIQSSHLTGSTSTRRSQSDASVTWVVLFLKKFLEMGFVCCNVVLFQISVELIEHGSLYWWSCWNFFDVNIFLWSLLLWVWIAAKAAEASPKRWAVCSVGNDDDEMTITQSQWKSH